MRVARDKDRWRALIRVIVKLADAGRTCVINFRIASLSSPFDRARFLAQIAALPMNKFCPVVNIETTFPPAPYQVFLAHQQSRLVYANSRKIYRAFELYRSTTNRVSSKLRCREREYVCVCACIDLQWQIYLEFRSFPPPRQTWLATSKLNR